VAGCAASRAREQARVARKWRRSIICRSFYHYLPVLRCISPWRLRYHDDMQQFDRITMDPEVMGGKPCIRGMRVTVGMIVEAMSAGRTIEQLLADFPYIEEPDIREALGFAARLAQGHEIRLAS
jgi:uncharacterized protein (DUF433 family)